MRLIRRLLRTRGVMGHLLGCTTNSLMSSMGAAFALASVTLGTNLPERLLQAPTD